MKGHSGVFTGGRLPIFWSSGSSSHVLSVQFLPWRPHGGGLEDHLPLNVQVMWRRSKRTASQSLFYQREKRLHDGGFLPLPILSTGGRDRQVGQAHLHPNCITAREQIVILPGDRASQRWANTPFVHLHGMVFTRRGIGDWSQGALGRSVISSWGGSHLCLCTLVEQVVTFGDVLPRRVLLKVGFLLGNVFLEAFKVFTPHIYFLLYPLSRGTRSFSVSLNEII